MNASCVYTTEKSFTLGEPPLVPNVWTHSPFVSFETTKGEIRVKKGDFWGDLEGFWGDLGLSHPTHLYLGPMSQKNVSFLGSPYAILILLISRCTSGSESCYMVPVIDGRGKSRWQRGCISQYLPSFGGIRSFYSSSGSARDKFPSRQRRIHIVKFNSSL